MSHRLRPVVTRAADEICGTSARLIAYILSLALLGILGLSLWDQLPRLDPSEPTKAAWTAASHSHQAYAVSHLDGDARTETYEILRHPQGGRKDIFRWANPDDTPVAELEIYRIGTEADAAADPRADIAARMPPAGGSDLETAGIINSKFGTVTLLRRVGTSGSPDSCLGFLKLLDQPVLQISGWSCQGTSIPTRRAAVGCLFDRLTLLASGNDPKLAEFFARAELRRGSCTSPALSGDAADWLTRADSPRLRGAL